MNFRRLLFTGALALLVAAGGCKDLSAPNENDPDVAELTENPSRATILSAAQGLMITSRDSYEGAADVVSALGIVGRESYNLDTADPRWVTEMLAGQFTGGGFGDFMWFTPYRSIRHANTILNAVDQIPTSAASDALTAQEKEAIRGFAKTIQALDFLVVIVTRDDLGAPIDVGVDINADPAPFADKQAVYERIETLLDEAQGHLQSAGSSFPFTLSSGFAGFEDPSGTFLEFNRAVAARVDVYMAGEFGLTQKYQEALNDLDASFITPASPNDPATPGAASIGVDGLRTGVYHEFSGTAGDETNDLFQPGEGPNIRAHPSIRDSAETQSAVFGSDTLDARYIRKTRDLPEIANFGGAVIGSDVAFDIYGGVGAPIPIIRNEELILLRAEANIGLGNLAAAEDDINFIRNVSGNLADVTFANAQEALDQLLYEKKYSLLFEGGHHWIDMRRYDRLDHLVRDRPSHIVHENWIIPSEECDANPNAPQAGCAN